jgi:hypothetical protein
MDIGVYDMVRYSKHFATHSNGIHGLHEENSMESTQQAATPTKL